MSIEITVAVDGVTHEISPIAGDLVRLERAYSISAADLNEENVTIEHAIFLAWCSLRRRGIISRELEFDDFLDHVDVPPEMADTDPLPPPPRD